MKPLKLLIPLLLCGIVQTASAGDTEKRLELLERRVQALSDIVNNLQSIQREVQQLRGEVETQNHAMDALTSRQRDFYLDLEQRLKQLQGMGQAALTGESATAGEPPPTSPPTADGMTGMEPHGTQPPPVAPTDSGAQPDMGSPVGLAEEKAAYDDAFKQLMGHRYPEASRSFQEFLRRYPDSAYAGNAQYWLGEAAYALKNYPQALRDLDGVVQRYGQSSKVPDALLKMGYIYYEQEQWERARDMLDRVIREYPSPTSARLAAKKLDLIRREGH